MAKGKFYKIEMVIIAKELNHLIKSLEKSGGSYSESMLRLIKAQKQRQDENDEKEN